MTSQNPHNIPETQNTEWGFWGTLNEHAETGWPMAMTTIGEATGCDFDANRPCPATMTPSAPARIGLDW